MAKPRLSSAGRHLPGTKEPVPARVFAVEDVVVDEVTADRDIVGGVCALAPSLEGLVDLFFRVPGVRPEVPHRQGTLDGTPVLTMSVAGMLAMKEQYPRLRNGRPWRQKDIDDIKALRGLAAGADAQP